MKNIYRVLCVVVFAIGIVVLSGSQPSVSQTGQNKYQNYYKDIEPALPFVVTYVESRIEPGGAYTLTGWRTRYVKANGEWRAVLHGLNRKKVPSEGGGTTQDVVYAGLPEGVVAKGAGSSEIKSVSPSAVSNNQKQEFFRSAEYLKTNREFVRAEAIAGLEAYVLRYVEKNLEHPIEWIETSYSPKTGLNPLRIVRRFRDGSELRLEAINVVFKDVPEDLNDDLRALPNTGKLGDQSPPNK